MRVVLNDIRSKHNVGSVLRTSDAAGVEKVYMCGYSPAPIDKFGRPNNQLIKVSLGAEDYVDWEQTDEQDVELLQRLKEEGFEIWVLEQNERSVNYMDMDLDKKRWEKVVLVLGNEVYGVPEDIIKMADVVIEVPMHGKKASLNVSVVYGVVAYGLRQIAFKK
jgi:tRNA G18 (ribose-2'-O)-methylase SpoU